MVDVEAAEEVAEEVLAQAETPRGKPVELSSPAVLWALPYGVKKSARHFGGESC